MYTLKDGYCEMIRVPKEARRGDAKAAEALKQGMAVTIADDGSDNAVASKASGTGNYDVYFVKKYGRNEVTQLYNANSIETVAIAERFVAISAGSIAIDQYVGSIGDYDVGDLLEIGTSGNAGLVTNYNATPVGDPVAVVEGKDYDKLIIRIL